MNERDFTLADDWQGQDPTGWLLSEKFDGCRAYWDGAQLWTRGGNVIDAPAWFTEGLPSDQHLDGELWAGRGKFQRASNAARLGSEHFGRSFLFVVFDCPTARGTWQERMTIAADSIVNARHAQVATYRPCAGLDDLVAEFLRVTNAGAEGLCLRHPRVARYETRRTENLLKVRWSHFIAEQMQFEPYVASAETLSA